MAIQSLESNQMQVNPSKFQFMAMYCVLNPGSIKLTIGNQVIQSVECIQLLGIHIDNKLSFDKHISTLCQQASQQFNRLNRIVKFLSKESKECLFSAFILSNFMCGNLVWHFLSKKNALEIDKVNRKGLRIVANDYTLPYADLLSTTNDVCGMCHGWNRWLMKCVSLRPTTLPHVLKTLLTCPILHIINVEANLGFTRLLRRPHSVWNHSDKEPNYGTTFHHQWNVHRAGLNA